MIVVNIKRDKKGNITSFFAKGHAEAAPHGEDIVCAAVSAILQTAVFGLTKHLNLEPKVEVNDGWLNCQLSSIKAQEDEVRAILETMFIGLKETADVYSEYIKVSEVVSS
jgi:hypothetical protein